MVEPEFSLTDLIASSIHDMKNSLNLQVHALEHIAAQSQARGDDAVVQDLGRVIYQAHRMNLNLVELLSLYKLSKSLYPLEISEHPVAELIGEAVQQNQSLLAFKGITVTQDCPAGLDWYVDRELVKGVLVNALNNAYHYTRGRIHASARVHAGQLLLCVDDDGAGYPAHMLERIQEGRGVDFETGSTGLGFYFCDQVARLHRNGERLGGIHIENGGSLGGGRFVLRLP